MTSLIKYIARQKNSALALSPETHKKIKDLILDGFSDNTKRSYQAGIHYFWNYAESVLGLERNIYPIPPETIIEFILYETEQKNISISTLEHRLSALSQAHLFLNLANPLQEPQVRTLRRAIRKKKQVPHKKKAIKLDYLNALLGVCDPTTLAGIRDAAIIYFGFATGGRRRSEIANAHMDYLSKETLPTGDQVYIYTLTGTKTLKGNKTAKVPVKGKAAKVLSVWLEQSGITNGYIFRKILCSGQLRQTGNPLRPKAITYILKKRCQQAGLDPDEFSAHSLRSGFMTESARQGINLSDAMKLSTHKTASVAMDYYEGFGALENPAGDLCDE